MNFKIKIHKINCGIMGIDYENILMYGSIFSYKELENIKKFEMYTEDSMRYTWEETSNYLDLELKILSPYYDCDDFDTKYIIGKTIKSNEINTLSDIERENIHLQILNFCKEYKLLTPNFYLISGVHVY